MRAKKTSQTTARNQSRPTAAQRILGASFRELWEEMGVAFAVPLRAVVVDAIVIGHSLLWVCAVNGISCKTLNNLIALKRSMPYAYTEITKCKHIAEGDLDGCSSYVRGQFDNVLSVYRTWHKKPLHFKAAMRVVEGKWA